MIGGPSEKEVRKAMFDLFDTNMDGFVNVDEVMALCRTAAGELGAAFEVPSEATLRQMIAEADSDGDGQLSEKEFFELVESI